MIGNPGSPAIEVFLVVESPRPPTEITALMQAEPTSGRRFKRLSDAETVTEWSIKLADGPQTIAVIDSSEDLLRARGTAWITALRAIGADPLASACMLVVQRATDDRQTKGIVFSRWLVDWLAQAGAFVSIDQYFGM